MSNKNKNILFLSNYISAQTPYIIKNHGNTIGLLLFILHNASTFKSLYSLYDGRHTHYTATVIQVVLRPSYNSYGGRRSTYITTETQITYIRKA